MSNQEPNLFFERPITPTMEDYLETIFNLSKEKRAVRVRDISKRLGVRMPTVTNMLKVLSKQGLIEYEKYEHLELTGKGFDIGSEIDHRHNIIRSFLTGILKVDSEKADEEACNIEHGISQGTLDKLIEFMDFAQTSPKAGSSWLKNFHGRLSGHKAR
jgi:DtxR family Mn-dependent transcriptional regulator